ncbi:MAG: ABC transporter ATP-binding protein/permease [Anaeroplasmataceae bacterium]|nr:ABC transporter ATP-binding protein/permease [Anaeroplasmataceae bacterium]
MVKKECGFFETIKRQLGLIRKGHFSHIYVLWIVNAIFGGAVSVLGVFFTKLIIDCILEEKSIEEMSYRIMFLSVIAILCFSIHGIVKRYLDASYLKLRQKEFLVCIELYKKVDYEKIEDPTFQDEVNVGFRALDGDYQGFQAVYSNLGNLFVGLISIIIFTTILAFLNVWIAVLCIVTTLITAIANEGVARYINKCKKDEAHAYRQNQYFHETCSDFSYGKDIRIFSLKESLMKKYQGKSLNLMRVLTDIANKKFLYALFGILMLCIEDGVSFYLIIQGYFDQTISLADVSLYVTTLVAFTTLLRTFTSNLTDLISNVKLTGTYFSFLDNQKFYLSSGMDKDVDLACAPKIEFKNVWFKYPNTEAWIFKDFNFTINPEESLAIVGENGAGKSTLIKLLCGLFKPTKGEILINGKDALSYDKQTYYSMFSTVFQDYDVYACTILENVVGTDQGKDAIERGKECLRRVGLEDKVLSLPLKYDTPMLKVIDENGVDFSGGQKQKLAIARALYKNGNVVILDEPTSALDALAEAEIYQSFDDLVKSKTAIYISHRLSSTKFCDKIAFLSKDGLEEYGSHEELMKNKKGYYHMFVVQGKYYQEGVEGNEEK